MFIDYDNRRALWLGKEYGKDRYFISNIFASAYKIYSFRQAKTVCKIGMELSKLPVYIDCDDGKSLGE